MDIKFKTDVPAVVGVYHTTGYGTSAEQVEQAPYTTDHVLDLDGDVSMHYVYCRPDAVNGTTEHTLKCDPKAVSCCFEHTTPGPRTVVATLPDPVVVSDPASSYYSFTAWLSTAANYMR